MKIVKKRLFSSLISFGLVLILFISLFYLMPVSATNITEIKFGEVTGRIGEEVIVPITITNNPGIATFRFRISYDTDALAFLSVEKGDVLSFGTLDAESNLEAKTLTFLWYSVSNVVGDGEIARLKFKISETAKGEYPLSVTYLEEDLLNETGAKVPYTVQEGKIITGVECSGKVTSFNSNTDIVTVELYEEASNTLSYITTTVGNNSTYSIEGVSPGVYIMKISKDNHVTREYVIEIGKEEIVQDAKIHLLGDIDGNGVVNVMDANQASLHTRGVRLLTEYAYDCANIDKNAVVNVMDVNRIILHARGKVKLW